MVAVVVARAAVAAVAVAAMVAAARRCKTRSLRTARLCNGCACIRSCTTWRTPAAGLAVAAEMAGSEAAVAVVAKAPASLVAVAVDLEGSYARGEPRTIGRSRPSSRCPQGCDDDAPVRLQCSIWPRARACCRRSRRSRSRAADRRAPEANERTARPRPSVARAFSLRCRSFPSSPRYYQV